MEMKKEEKKADLEQLLNSLIKKGWKPRGKDQKFEIWIENLPYKKLRVCLKKPDYDYYVYSYRDLVSVESQLWQFCVENGMVKSETGVWVNGVNGMYKEILINQYDYRYRLIESSLKDESELESFILDNIKIGNEQL